MVIVTQSVQFYNLLNDPLYIIDIAFIKSVYRQASVNICDYL